MSTRPLAVIVPATYAQLRTFGLAIERAGYQLAVVRSLDEVVNIQRVEEATLLVYHTAVNDTDVQAVTQSFLHPPDLVVLEGQTARLERGFQPPEQTDDAKRLEHILHERIHPSPEQMDEPPPSADISAVRDSKPVEIPASQETDVAGDETTSEATDAEQQPTPPPASDADEPEDRTSEQGDEEPPPAPEATDEKQPPATLPASDADEPEDRTSEQGDEEPPSPHKEEASDSADTREPAEEATDGAAEISIAYADEAEAETALAAEAQERPAEQTSHAEETAATAPVPASEAMTELATPSSAEEPASEHATTLAADQTDEGDAMVAEVQEASDTDETVAARSYFTVEGESPPDAPSFAAETEAVDSDRTPSTAPGLSSGTPSVIPGKATTAPAVASDDAATVLAERETSQEAPGDIPVAETLPQSTGDEDEQAVHPSASPAVAPASQTEAPASEQAATSTDERSEPEPPAQSAPTSRSRSAGIWIGLFILLLLVGLVAYQWFGGKEGVRQAMQGTQQATGESTGVISGTHTEESPLHATQALTQEDVPLITIADTNQQQDIDIVAEIVGVFPENPAAGDVVNVQVRVQNRGSQPVSEPFWVDLYVSPEQQPVVNLSWNDISPYGATWLVENLDANESLVLESLGADASRSNLLRFATSGNRTFQVLADSYGIDGTGALKEQNEDNNLSELVEVYISPGDIQE